IKEQPVDFFRSILDISQSQSILTRIAKRIKDNQELSQTDKAAYAALLLEYGLRDPELRPLARELVITNAGRNVNAAAGVAALKEIPIAERLDLLLDSMRGSHAVPGDELLRAVIALDAEASGR
ncbi:MAG: hypothetical protein PHF00_14070, partial [Elusimicrobia bacterium]|nr:hypothetical protein [Elusimicrobiota bacterium]